MGLCPDETSVYELDLNTTNVHRCFRQQLEFKIRTKAAKLSKSRGELEHVH
jgi:hypothetical protein